MLIFLAIGLAEAPGMNEKGAKIPLQLMFFSLGVHFTLLILTRLFLSCKPMSHATKRQKGPCRCVDFTGLGPFYEKL